MLVYLDSIGSFKLKVLKQLKVILKPLYCSVLIIGQLFQIQTFEYDP